MSVIKKTLAACLVMAHILGVQGRTSPLVVPASEASRLAGTFNTFTCDNIVFYKGKLYAGAPMGLLEFEKASLAKIYVWNKKGTVVDEGPWHDAANDLLWIKLREHGLLYYDGANWHASGNPKPSHGSISREDVWRGFRGVSDRKTFWIEGTYRAWKWGGHESRTWTEELFPKSGGSSATLFYLIKRVIPSDKETYYVLRDHGEPVLQVRLLRNRVRGDSVYFVKEGKLTEITNHAQEFSSVETAAANNRGYILTKSGDLLQVTKTEVSKLSTPGQCEGIVRSAAGALVASFRDVGVFELREDWRPLLRSPYPPGERDYASSVFSLLSFKDIASFVAKLQNSSDAVSSFLNSKLSEGTRQALAKYKVGESNVEPLQQLLVQDLNAIIEGELIYDTERFTAVSLRRATKHLVQFLRMVPRRFQWNWRQRSGELTGHYGDTGRDISSIAGTGRELAGDPHRIRDQGEHVCDLRGGNGQALGRGNGQVRATSDMLRSCGTDELAPPQRV